MSHTPWLGVAMARFCQRKENRRDLRELYGKLMQQPHITLHYPSSILQDRRWKDPPRNLSHVIFHFDPKLLDVRVKVEVCVLHLWGAKITSHILQLTCRALHP